MFKMASQVASTCILSSNLLCNKGQRSGLVHLIFLPREAYYSSQVIRLYRVLEYVELSALETDGTIEQCGCGFQAAQLVTPLLYQPWLTLETMLHAEMPKPDAFVAQRAWLAKISQSRHAQVVVHA